ncbi:MAG TPA: Fic family protein [Longimicrobium sp.]
MKIPMPPPGFADLLNSVRANRLIASMSAIRDAATEYHHWDELRHRTPPGGLSTSEWWLALKLARRSAKREVSLFDKAGFPFSFNLPDEVLRDLHFIDQHAAGQIQIAEEVTNPASRDRYIISSLIEEAITSSQLEGASTTREAARQMLRSGRAPSTRSEQMILNNFHAMEFVREHAANTLSPGMVFELHRIVTADTLNEPEKAGRFRDEQDEIVVQDETGNVLHVPPSASELADRLKRLCTFANDTAEGAFVHPVVRAMLLHFTIGYDHPFVDGNGRTARALFYWGMLSRGYWLAEYVSISRILKRAPSQYARAFLYPETDESDLTYFLLHQLRVMRRAIGELQEHLRKKVKEVREVQHLLRGDQSFNHRQLALLGHALKHAGKTYTIQSHQRSHGVVYQTARADLLSLASRGLLMQQKVGRAFVFIAPTDLAERLANVRVPSSDPTTSLPP